MQVHPTPELSLEELPDPKQEADALYALVIQLTPELSRKRFAELLEEMPPKGYRVLVSRQNGRICGMAGFWVQRQFWSDGAHLECDNVIVDKGCRGLGVGRQLIAWLEEEGRRLGCAVALLKVYEANKAAQAFYGQLGYDTPGRVMLKPLQMNRQEWDAMLQARVSRIAEPLREG